MPVLSQLASERVKLLTEGSSVASNTTGNVWSVAPADDGADSKKIFSSNSTLNSNSWLYLLSQTFSKYFPVGSPWSISGRSAFKYVDGPSGSVL